MLHAEGRTSFGELDRAADAVARLLRQRGVEPGSLVALCAEPSAEMLAGILGILKAGAAYLPLDPEHPEGRLAAVLRDSGARALLAPGSLLGRLPAAAAERVRLEDAAEWAGAPAPSGPRARTTRAPPPTSSTPPAPPARQRAWWWSTAGWCTPCWPRAARWGWGRGTWCPPLAAFTFDISVLELFAPLLAGAPVALRSRADAMDPGRLLEGLAGVTVLHAVPSLMRELVAHVRARGPRGFAPRLLLWAATPLPGAAGGDARGLSRGGGPGAVRPHGSFHHLRHPPGGGGDSRAATRWAARCEGVSLFVLDAAGELAPPRRARRAVRRGATASPAATWAGRS